MKKAFKILTLFVAIASMACVTSCTKDKEDLIVGKWKFYKADVSITLDDPEMQAIMDQYLAVEVEELNAEMQNDQLEFRGDHTCVNIDEDGESEPGTWSINGDQLTVDGELITIKSLTKKSLVLEMVEAYEDEEDEMTGTWVFTIEYKRM